MNYKKLNLGKSIEEESFSLIAIHTSIEDFQLAYFINKNCNTRFKRTHHLFSSHLKKEIMALVWENSWDEETFWYLFPNRYDALKKIKKNNPGLLFENETHMELYILPEFKQVDYFIKIPNYNSNDFYLKKIKELAEIQTAYSIHEDSIKSSKNLIFN
ncbi:MAG: IPExxxVDY family protein [Flavobacteriaceae bacterium]|nr:IPExxxVDY family protein [Flavobacteriaceae bacterium]